MPMFRGGGNERGREETPTSISILDSYDIKTLGFEFGNYIFTGFKKPHFKVEMSYFQPFY